MTSETGPSPQLTQRSPESPTTPTLSRLPGHTPAAPSTYPDGNGSPRPAGDCVETQAQSDRVADIVRGMIDRENDLINHRVTWLTTTQGLLFAALGFSWDRQGTQRLVVLLCFLGIAMSIVAISGLTGATIAMHRVLRWWKDYGPKDYKGPAVIGFGFVEKPFLRYIGVWTWIPILFLAAWVGVLTIRFY